uniref:Ig-like domain-containing protein n=1 Tax=Nothobranchius furzeri TaxID=105023 RepID=A0A8C6L9H9_NOTFU
INTDQGGYASAEYLSSSSSYSSERFSLMGKHTASEAKLELSTSKADQVLVHKEKPSNPAKFLTKPLSVTVTEGETARFSCDIDGEPSPTTTWLHENKIIVSSHSIQVSTTQYKSSLEISSVKSSDEAKTIEWSRSGKAIEVTSGGRFHIETTDDLTTLIITGVKEEDTGAYTLKLSNELGSDTATVHISIRSV